MANLQCKMCGGSVNLPEGVTSGECPYCGSLTTFPKQTDERLLQLCARAEHFRQLNDFDRAMEAYEKVLELDDSDPDVHWGLLLSRFGIEYVEDPSTRERIPTCHRVQHQSILTDPDCLAALELSSGCEHDYYQEQAGKIADIQKQILAVSSREEPYDVFICYKETSESGTRTKDSALAQDVYYQLVKQGYKVFFARITLEDKLGQQYEPYIFSALNSAKVMLVIGTCKAHFEAVWVKNEWSRFLSLMRGDAGKVMIPCYRDMDPYDLPEELSMLQSQDLSKIGCIQDILHGIGKVIDAARQNDSDTQQHHEDGDNTQNLFKRIQFFLFDGDFDSARQYCWQILDHDPSNLDAYFYQLLAECHMKDEEALPQCEEGEAPEDSGSAKVILRSQNQELKAKVQKICRRHQQIPAFKRGMELMQPILDSLSKMESPDNREEAALNILPHTMTLCKANACLLEAAEIPQAQETASSCREVLYNITRFLALPKIQQALLDPSQDFAQSYPWLAPTIMDLSNDLTNIAQQDRKVGMLVQLLPQSSNRVYEETINNLLRALFPILRDYKETAELEASFREYVLKTKSRLVQVAFANHDYPRAIMLLEPLYLESFSELQGSLQKTLESCYNRGMQLLTADHCDEALPLFVATARHSFKDSYDLVMYCNLAPQRRAKKIALAIRLVGYSFLALIFLIIIILSMSNRG